jgi:hypothetical protein
MIASPLIEPRFHGAGCVPSVGGGIQDGRVRDMATLPGPARVAGAQGVVRRGTDGTVSNGTGCGGCEIGAASISGAAQHDPALTALSARVTGSGGAAPTPLRGVAQEKVPTMAGEIFALSDGVFVAFADLAAIPAAHFF